MTKIQTYNINENIVAKYQMDKLFANLRGGELGEMSSEEVLEKVKRMIQLETIKTIRAWAAPRISSDQNISVTDTDKKEMNNEQ